MIDRDAASGSTTFASSVIAWQKQSGRHNLPWQNTTDPYRIWLSEIMLQQTQVAAVIPYFQRFLARFPMLKDLAAASEDVVMASWSGLGYYARARNLHRTAREIVEHRDGQFPDQFEDIVALPGIGRSTAGAIAVFAFNHRFPILDGNVRRLFARVFGVEGYTGTKAVTDRLWALADRLLPERDVRAYTQGLMDLGAQICVRSRPNCEACPCADQCVARLQSRTAELPTPRPRVVRPHKSTVMLILERNGAVLMEKRPDVGIWGGLWSFPEIDAIDMGAIELAQQVCQSRFGVDVDLVELMEPLQHGFTHYSLQIQPMRCRVSRQTLLVEAPGRAWIELADAPTQAIPVPVRKLVAILSGAQPVRLVKQN